MNILYTTTVPQPLSGGLVFFRMRGRTMSKIKSKIWKTFSHVGIIYKSSFTGMEKSWVSFMDEVYGLITCPMEAFLSSPELEGWMVRPMVEMDPEDYKRFKGVIRDHSGDDSNLSIDPETFEILGSFDDELKNILGIPVVSKPRGLNTNLGYVEDILSETCSLLGIEPRKPLTIGFSDEYDNEDEIIEGISPAVVEDGLLKTVNNLLGMVNLTTYDVRPPIQNLISRPHKLLEDRLYQPVTGGFPAIQTSIFPSLTEERCHVADIIAKIFSSGLSGEGLHEVFEEELDTTTMARRGKTEMTRELIEDLMTVLDRHLHHIKTMLDKKTLPTTEDKRIHNENLSELITAEGSLLAHTGITRKLATKSLEME